ncbi:hypothetical protein SCHPADRAFT_863786 [Schizopora paradoxa]|uniref:RINT-1 family protein n=1 Tax=Schizopora paradoxa TaxID=27342 RepID=A0A0H2S7W4_9AGAM|nr:hypothetical protein SCHPADRAFT_863786 [Schizopora paradoxa]
MASAQIELLSRPADKSASIDYAVAFLNARFSSFDQLQHGNALDDALKESQQKAERLQAQLLESQAFVNDLVRDTKAKATERLSSAQELALLRHSVADEILSLSEELSSANVSEMRPTLLEEIETMHRNIKELESVKGYVQVVQSALTLSERVVNAVKSLDTSLLISESSLSDYKALQSLTSTIQGACSQADDGTGQGVFLPVFLNNILDKTWLLLKETLSDSLIAASEQLQWPMPVDYAAASEDNRSKFQHAFINLTTLQSLGDKLHKDQKQHEHKPTDGLYPLQALIRPVAQRFKYHFEGSRQTNRLDKPEWYFAHILNLTHEHRRFMDNVVQRLLHNSPFEALNAWREFTRLLLPIVSRKLRRSVPSILTNPPLLAHTVYQCLAFDDALRDAGFSFVGTSAQTTSSKPEDWEGCSEIILGNKEWFESWLAGEQKFTEAQYETIISSPDAWTIVNDEGEQLGQDNELRPTISARRIKVLVEQVTDRYKVLPQFLHKTRFLIGVQVPILELYHTRISESLDAFEALSSYFVRAVPGALSGQSSSADSKRATAGTEGSSRLIKGYVSAKWTAVVMSNWGEDIFFLELWHSICERAALRSRVREVDALPDPSVVRDEGTIFDELVKQYNALAERAETMLVKQICGEVESDLKAHLFKPPATTPGTGEVILSQTLLAPIARLSAHLTLVHQSLPTNTTTNLYRQIASHISNHILQRQVLYQGRGRMTSQEGKNVLDEARLWVETSRMALGGSVRRVEGPWEKLVDSGKLLSLDGEAFAKAVRISTMGSEAEYQTFCGDLGLSSTSREEATDVLKVREDYPK